MNSPQFTAEEIDRMRQLVAAHDATAPRKPQVFDINNPPKVPYSHQEFPRVVYHHGDRKHHVVHTKGQMRDALEAGFDLEPFPSEPPPEPELTEAEKAEIAAIDKAAKSKRKG